MPLLYGSPSCVRGITCSTPAISDYIKVSCSTGAFESPRHLPPAATGAECSSEFAVQNLVQKPSACRASRGSYIWGG